VLVSVHKKTSEIRKTEIRGRWLYCIKCRKAAEVGGIELPEVSREDSTFALILAVSNGCGKFYKLDATEKKKLDMRSSVVRDYEPGDKVLGPDDHPWGIIRSPLDDRGFFIHETVCEAVIPRED